METSHSRAVHPARYCNGIDYVLPGTYDEDRYQAHILILNLQETPRWLLSKDRREEAIAIMAKYHGEGDPNSPVVQLQLHEITQDFSATQNENPWWEFRELFNSRGARYRLAMVICMAFFGQWSGNNVVSYFSKSSIPLQFSNNLQD
jgi:hypothetical protein